MKQYKIYVSLGLLIFLTIISWITSCTHEGDVTDFPEICFEADILPIFANSCAISGCHNGQGESDLVLNSYLDISHSVIPGYPYKSKVYKAITTATGEDKMPPDQPLSLESRTLIRVWIEQGAKLTICPENNFNNGGDDAFVNPRACFTRDILPVLVSRCATTDCHDEITHQEGYIFTSYTSTIRAVKPGNIADSKIYEVIMKTGGEDKMPPAGYSQLTIAEKDSIAAWIRYGALNENCGELCDTINPVTFSGTIWPVIQTSCSGCHSGTSPSGNITLASYNNVATVASSGLLIQSLKGDGVPKMPPAGFFSACKIRQFEIWVNEGFLNN